MLGNRGLWTKMEFADNLQEKQTWAVWVYRTLSRGSQKQPQRPRVLLLMAQEKGVSLSNCGTRRPVAGEVEGKYNCSLVLLGAQNPKK